MAFLGIKVPHEVGRMLASIELPGNVQAASKYHITLFYFQKDMPINQISKAMKAVFEVVSEFKPFTVKTTKITTFDSEKEIPIIAKVVSKELNLLQEEIKKALVKHKVKFSDLYPEYKPHITLSYHNEKIDNFTIEPVEFTVNDVVLWGGDHGDDKLSVTFQLKPPCKKNALLIKNVDFFEKISYI